ncbi:DegV family protein [Candidatus Heimdallarchaeota archaeon]|nr:MAG: DegV family protein [Candidatus Heimdallarchaeota archaeon]
MKIGYVTDSGSDIDAIYADKIGVKVVPLTITFSDEDGVVYKEDRDFDLDSYYNKYSSVDDFLAKTAQPTPHDFFVAYEELVKEGVEEIIVVTLSSGLSGTINSARLGYNMLKRKKVEVKVHLVDSLHASYAEVLLIEEGLRLQKQGLEGEEIAKRLREHVSKFKIYILFPSLKYLRKGGRISVTKYILGTLLRKRPITVVNKEGKNEVAGSATNTDEGIHKILEMTSEGFTRFPKQVIIIHGNNEDYAQRMEKQLREYFDDVKIRKKCTGVTISAHTGPDVVALISEF